MICQVKLLNCTFDKLCSTILRDSFDPSEVVDILLDGHVLKDKVVLRAVANKFLDVLEVFANVICTNVNGAHGRLNLGGQTLESRGLSSTIDAKQSKAFTCLEAK